MQERQFPFEELFLLFSGRCSSETVRVNGQSLQVSEAAQFDWSQAQLAFFVAGAQALALYAAEAAPAAWWSMSAACLPWSRTCRSWYRASMTTSWPITVIAIWSR
ncbi:MAG: hypothetical protein ACR5LG_08365 [Sodalis sp. (in: enterobacteria)]|uniref:hypothetical protein n=1 Tax=Sodalis sp. (in: enterobacteria) TaxID=1898979 RepID=UPI003F33EF81